MSDDFWTRPEVVQRFAQREPDHRLRALVQEYDSPSTVHVLDIGCAGGRNTVFLAERGFDVQAADASEPMVRETRRRLLPILGEAEARERVRVARMDDLSGYRDSTFDLVISLGLLHNAHGWGEWRRAVGETARVLAPGGLLLLNQFTPATRHSGREIRPMPGKPHLYEGLTAGPGVLLDAETLDAEVAHFGLRPETPSETVTGQAERGERVSVNALYRKT